MMRKNFISFQQTMLFSISIYLSAIYKTHSCIYCIHMCVCMRHVSCCFLQLLFFLFILFCFPLCSLCMEEGKQEHSETKKKKTISIFCSAMTKTRRVGATSGIVTVLLRHRLYHYNFKVKSKFHGPFFSLQVQA